METLACKFSGMILYDIFHIKSHSCFDDLLHIFMICFFTLDQKSLKFIFTYEFGTSVYAASKCSLIVCEPFPTLHSRSHKSSHCCSYWWHYLHRFSHLQPGCNQLYSRNELFLRQLDTRACSLRCDLRRGSALQHETAHTQTESPHGVSQARNASGTAVEKTVKADLMQSMWSVWIQPCHPSPPPRLFTALCILLCACAHACLAFDLCKPVQHLGWETSTLQELEEAVHSQKLQSKSI